MSIAQNTKEIPRVPDWAKDAVWYQIFPERFANGDSSNDPTPHDMQGAWPYKIPDGWQISPWTSDWYKLQPWEKSTGHDFYWNAGVRRYGGDIQGIIDHLDYLQDLGITAIYLTPIFESPSSHKYDTRMYHHVDNNFGPNPAEDEKIWATENPADPSTWKWTSADKLFLKLIQEVHKRGMKIILDGVFNHVGTSFWAFQDVVKNQQKSAFKDWFRIRAWDDPNTPQNEFEYEGWNGVKDLPEIKKNNEQELAPGFGEHVHAIIKRWMDPNGDGDPSDGIDGWRLDVAEKVGIPFWRQFRSWVKDVNPNGYITGEIWWENWPINQMFVASPWLQGDAFDGVMNYRFAQAVKKFVADRKDQISAKAFADSITAPQKEYHPDNLYVLQNLLDSHDVDRIGSQLVNPDRWYDHYANPGQNKAYYVRKPTETELAKQKLIAGIQMTMPGAPMIYYGDEAGMWGGDDPDCRKPMVWPDKKYDIEVSDPLGRKREPDSVNFNTDLYHWYKGLISIRRQHKALSRGDLNFFLLNDEEHVVAYSRTLGDEMIIIVVNNSNDKKSVVTTISAAAGNKNIFMNLLDGRMFRSKGNKYTIDLKPYEIMILQ
jgi:glycosidase